MGNSANKSKPPTILVIEDENHLQVLLQQVLSDAGYQTHHATSGQLGLQLAETNAPDLVLLDLMLPGTLNGFEVLTALKANTKTKKIPVFVLTNLESEKEKTFALGAEAYLIKVDLSLDDLREKIARQLSKHR